MDRSAQFRSEPLTSARLHHGLNRLLAHAFPVFWTVAPPGLLRLLPGSSRHFGPPRRSAWWAALREQPGRRWRSVLPARAEVLPPPFFCSRLARPLEGSLALEWPEAGVAEIPGGRLLDEHAWPVAPADTFIADFALNGTSRHCHVRRIIKLQPLHRLPGRTLNLCSAHAATNFFHFVADALSRVELVRRAGYAWKDFDRIMLPRFDSVMARDIVAAAGLPSDKIMRVGRREHFECEILIQPSFPGPHACTPRWVIEFYRELFPRPAGPRDRRLYIGRRLNRRPRNAPVIAQLLAARGFEEIDTMDAPRVRELLGRATHVVGTHGASLANLVFCPPGTRVLELMPSEMAAGHNRLFYSTLCGSAGLPYGVMVGRSPHHRLTPYSPQTKAPFDVDLAELERGVDALLAA